MAKTTKFAKTGIKREAGKMYYVKGGAVWSTTRKKPRRKKKVASFSGKLNYKTHVYFVDRAGDVAAAARPARRKKRKR